MAPVVGGPAPGAGAHKPCGRAHHQTYSHTNSNSVSLTVCLMVLVMVCASDRQVLHLLQLLALGLGHPEEDEDERQQGARGVEAVGEGEADAGEGREGGGDEEIGHPLGRRGHGQRPGADPVGEHLAEQHPHQRPPGGAEGDDEQVGGHQRDGRPGGAQRDVAAADVGEGEGQRHHPQGEGHDDRADQQHGPAPHLVHKEDGQDGDRNIGHRRDDRNGQSVGLLEADGAPQRRGVVEDDVDAHELLEDRQQDAHPDDGSETEGGTAKVGQGLALLGVDGGADLLDLEIDVDDAGEVVEDLGGLVVVAARHEEARGLGQTEGEEPVDEGGYGLGQEHPAPGRHTEPEGVGRAVSPTPAPLQPCALSRSSVASPGSA